jgi:hypothetical protein
MNMFDNKKLWDVEVQVLRRKDKNRTGGVQYRGDKTTDEIRRYFQ